MDLSYSFHLSSKKHALTNINKIKQVSRHNLRAYQEDKEGITILRGSDNVLEDVKRIYHQEFDEPLNEYNQGKREDRQIKNYLEHVSDSRSDAAAEIIIQIGDQEFWTDKTDEEKRKMHEVFEKQLISLEKLCPGFRIANATIHYDEKSPHMHVVGVPVADDYKKGMKKQVAKTKVFTKESLELLQDEMRADMEKSIEDIPLLFFGMKMKEKEKGRNKDIPKETLDKYYDLQTQNKELTDAIEEAEFYNDSLVDVGQGFVNQIDNLKNELIDKNERLHELDQEIATLEEKKTKVSQEVRQAYDTEIEKLREIPYKKSDIVKVFLDPPDELKSLVNQVKIKIREYLNNLTQKSVKKSILGELDEKNEQVKERDIDDYIKSIKVPVKEKEKGRSR